MEEKFGIENLKAVLAFGVTVGKNISTTLDDKKVTLQEVLTLIPAFMAVPDFIAKKDLIIEEAKDLSLDEIQVLITSVEGDVAGNDVVGIIEDALNFIVSSKNLIERFSKKAA